MLTIAEDQYRSRMATRRETPANPLLAGTGRMDERVKTRREKELTEASATRPGSSSHDLFSFPIH